MAKISFHHAGGGVDIVEAAPGTSVMRAAVTHGVPGIVGECGGQAMCATCHVYVRTKHLDGLPEISEDEEEMLDSTASPRDPQRSRLGCQLTVTGDADDIAVDVPESQV
jgi:2Fe-2S ferredoxin